MDRAMKALVCLGVFCLFSTGLAIGGETSTGATEVVVEVTTAESDSQPASLTIEAAVITPAITITEAPAEACETEACEEEQCESKETTVAEGEKKPKGSGLFGVIRNITGNKKSAPQQPAARESTPSNDDSFPATHHQVALLKVKPGGQDADATKANADSDKPAAPVYGRGGWGVKSFCLDGDDNLVVAVGDQEGELQILTPQGEVQRTISLPVVPEAVNIAPDGNYLVAGAGKVLKLDSSGSVLVEAESPVISYIEEHKDEMRVQVANSLKSRVKTYATMLESYQQRINQRMDQIASKLPGEQGNEYKLLRKLVAQHQNDAPEETDETEATDGVETRAWELRKELLGILETKVLETANENDKQYLDLFNRQVESFRQMMANMDENYPSEEEIDQALESQIASKSSFSSLSAVGSDVFIATRATEGYGYDVWRMDESLSGAERIVKDLRGCCGQMDVQACSAGLYVAENSRHQVNHFDRAGEKVNSWGSRGREGVRGFGGCCNPMNVAFGPDGSVYTAESTTGRIKRYSPEGELMQLIGSVELVPGCKKVSIGVTKDHQRVYMLDITRNHIIVMEAKPIETQAATSAADGSES